jgi:hypothetical protein
MAALIRLRADFHQAEEYVQEAVAAHARRRSTRLATHKIGIPE